MGSDFRRLRHTRQARRSAYKAAAFVSARVIRRGRPRTGMVRVRLIVGKCAIMRRRQLGRRRVEEVGCYEGEG